MESITCQTSAKKLSDLEPIGEGGFGIVFRAKHVDYGTVAYKKMLIGVITKRDDRMAVKMKHEAEVHSRLRHPNIVQMIAMVFEEDNYGIILEFMQYGSLDNFLSENSPSWAFILRAANDIATGMCYLHSLEMPVIHGDLKIQNVLVGDGFKAKVSDFGLSQWKQFSKSRSKVQHPGGTVTNVTPECWRDPNCERTVKYDVYGYGILLWEMATGEMPFSNCSPHLLKASVIDGHRPDCKKFPSDFPQEYQTLMEKSWSGNPTERPDFRAIKDELEVLLSRPDVSEKTKRDIVRLHTQVYETPLKTACSAPSHYPVTCRDDAPSACLDEQSRTLSAMQSSNQSSSLGTVTGHPFADSRVGSVVRQTSDTELKLVAGLESTECKQLDSQISLISLHSDLPSAASAAVAAAAPTAAADADAYQSESLAQDGPTPAGVHSSLSARDPILPHSGVSSISGGLLSNQVHVDAVSSQNDGENNNVPAAPEASNRGSQINKVLPSSQALSVGGSHQQHSRISASALPQSINERSNHSDLSGNAFQRSCEPGVGVGQNYDHQKNSHLHSSASVSQYSTGQRPNQDQPAGVAYPRISNPDVDVERHAQAFPPFSTAPAFHGQPTSYFPGQNFSVGPAAAFGQNAPNLPTPPHLPPGPVHIRSGKSDIIIHNFGSMGPGVQIGNYNVMHINSQFSSHGSRPRATGHSSGNAAESTGRQKIQLHITDRPVTPEDMQLVSTNIGSQWLSLARQLNFSDSDVDEIQYNNRNEGVAEAAYQMLRDWRERNGNDATLVLLANALLKVERADIAKMFNNPND